MANTYWLMVGLFMEEYRRIYYDHELDKRGIKAIDTGSSSLIELALQWGGIRSSAHEGLADTFIAIAESMIESELPADEVKKRIEEYVGEILGDTGFSRN